MLWVGLACVCVGSVSRVGFGQGSQTAAGSSAEPPIPTLTSGFAEPVRPSDPKFSQALGACVSAFERTLQTTRYDHPRELLPEQDTLFASEADWIPLAPDARAAAQSCYRRRYPSLQDVPDIEVGTLLSLAVAANDDSLVSALIARQLTRVGQNASARAQVLYEAVKLLMSNVWSESGSSAAHLTDAHVTLARHYTDQLEALGPRHIVMWIDAHRLLDQGTHLSGSDSEIHAASADVQHLLQVIRAVPPGALPDSVSKIVKAYEDWFNIVASTLRYLETLDHADVTNVAQAYGPDHQWLMARPAPPLSADYWFGTASQHPATLPAPKALSLIVFVAAHPDQDPKAATGNPMDDALIRRIHARFPALQIILMTTTQGKFANQSLVDHPEQEAAMTYQYFRDSLQLPGMVGVIKSQWRTVSEGHAFPILPPLLDQYMIDPQDIGGQMFLVDPAGWVVCTRATRDWLVPLIARFLARSSH